MVVVAQHNNPSAALAWAVILSVISFISCCCLTVSKNQDKAANGSGNTAALIDSTPVANPVAGSQPYAGKLSGQKRPTGPSTSRVIYGSDKDPRRCDIGKNAGWGPFITQKVNADDSVTLTYANGCSYTFTADGKVEINIV